MDNRILLIWNIILTIIVLIFGGIQIFDSLYEPQELSVEYMGTDGEEIDIWSEKYETTIVLWNEKTIDFKGDVLFEWYGYGKSSEPGILPKPWLRFSHNEKIHIKLESDSSMRLTDHFYDNDQETYDPVSLKITIYPSSGDKQTFHFYIENIS